MLNISSDQAVFSSCSSWGESASNRLHLDRNAHNITCSTISVLDNTLLCKFFTLLTKFFKDSAFFLEISVCSCTFSFRFSISFARAMSTRSCRELLRDFDFCACSIFPSSFGSESSWTFASVSDFCSCSRARLVRFTLRRTKQMYMQTTIAGSPSIKKASSAVPSPISSSRAINLFLPTKSCANLFWASAVSSLADSYTSPVSMISVCKSARKGSRNTPTGVSVSKVCSSWLAQKPPFFRKRQESRFRTNTSAICLMCVRVCLCRFSWVRKSDRR
mmetsp:Transcript_35582/g.69817  ORF Transcript_35582/g.69817 Transcript_35582/m.69817 type:complete len:275 (+) Transcript_35582:693-1517(+)